MKQNDIAAIILAVGVSFLASWFIFNAIFSGPTDQEAQVEVVNRITDEFPQPDNKIFTEGYLNPTELIKIDESDNQKPFER